MAGSKVGGAKAAATNKKQFGDNFYKRIGSIGGKQSSTGGFYYMKQNGQLDKIREAGRKGGQISRRPADT